VCNESCHPLLAPCGELNKPKPAHLTGPWAFSQGNFSRLRLTFRAEAHRPRDQHRPFLAMQPETQQGRVIGGEMSDSWQNSDSSSQQPGQTFKTRVGRACDECRTRKIKCDGKQPCLHCILLNYSE
jgi:hypothetical protein